MPRAKTATCGYVLATALLMFALPALQSGLVAQQKADTNREPRLVERVEPEYTPEALEANLSGTVVLDIEVGIDGRAQVVRVKKGLGLGLNEKAVEAVKQWKFEPAIRDGQPVAVKAVVEMNFRPPGLPADRGKKQDGRK
jgi:TonB family protein